MNAALALVVDNGPDWTPARYLHARRQAALITAAEVALNFASTNAVLIDGHVYSEAELEIEDGGVWLTEAELHQVRALFPFDVDVYLRLTQGMPFTALCSSCGCSWMDACIDEHGQGCRWSTSDPFLCTVCEAARP